MAMVASSARWLRCRASSWASQPTTTTSTSRSGGHMNFGSQSMTESRNGIFTHHSSTLSQEISLLEKSSGGDAVSHPSSAFATAAFAAVAASLYLLQPASSGKAEAAAAEGHNRATTTTTTSVLKTSSPLLATSAVQMEATPSPDMAFSAKTGLPVLNVSRRTKRKRLVEETPQNENALGIFQRSSAESSACAVNEDDNGLVEDIQTTTPGKSYDVSVEANQGRRVTMEDEVVVANGGRFVAVFDGHGGGDVSGFLRRHLYKLYLRNLEREHWAQSDEDEVKNITEISPSISCHILAVKGALRYIESLVRLDRSFDYVGSTAVVVLLHENEDGFKTLISCNIGDSRAVLSRKDKAVELTKDHKPTAEGERRRILQAGGRIHLDEQGVHRVMNLSLSRAVGDNFSKPIVSAHPDIRRFSVETDDQFIILASDGLWDVFSSQDAVSYVSKRMRKAEDSLRHLEPEERLEELKVVRSQVARELVHDAILKGSADNTSVVMVWLSDLDDQAQD